MGVQGQDEPAAEPAPVTLALPLGAEVDTFRWMQQEVRANGTSLVMNRHPVDGARIILQSEEDLELAATVASEHHVMLDGGGYPAMHYGRSCALASRLVHVCDVFDALSTRRAALRPA